MEDISSDSDCDNGTSERDSRSGSLRLRSTSSGDIYSSVVSRQQADLQSSLCHKDSKFIMHMDVDNFYVSAELLRHPELKGRCIAVTQFNSGGFVALSSEAKELGLRKGDGVGEGGRRNIVHLVENGNLSMEEAKRRCEEAGGLEVLTIDTDYYLDISWKIFARLRSKASSLGGAAVFKASYDDFYIDISSIVSTLSPCASTKLKDGFVPHPCEVKPEFLSREECAAVNVATMLKNEVQDLGLRVSVGVGSNKLIAKLASAHAKPQHRRAGAIRETQGTAIVPRSSNATFVADNPIGVVPGFGAKLGDEIKFKFDKQDLKLGDLAILSEGELQAELQVVAGLTKESISFLSQAAHGILEAPVLESGPPKSVSAERSFRPIDLSEEFKGIALELANQLLRRCSGPPHPFGVRVPSKLRIAFRSGYQRMHLQTTFKQRSGKEQVNCEASGSGDMPSASVGMPNAFKQAVSKKLIVDNAASQSVVEEVCAIVTKKHAPSTLNRLMLTAFDFGTFVENADRRQSLTDFFKRASKPVREQPLLSLPANGFGYLTDRDKNVLSRQGYDLNTFLELPADVQQSILEDARIRIPSIPEQVAKKQRKV